jgi:paired small multidrug resistance pump
MAWILLILAGLFETVGVIGLKRTAEKSNLINSLILYGGFVVSFFLLYTAMKTIDLSTAYAVWTGIGTVGAVAIGIIFFKESKSLIRIVCIMGIVCCVSALKWLS